MLQEARSRHAAHYAEVLQQAHQGIYGWEGMLRAGHVRPRAQEYRGWQAWAAWHADKDQGDAPSQAARLCMLYANTEYGFLDLRLSARSRLAWQEAASMERDGARTRPRR